MSHFILKCQYCCTVLAQCRCPSPAKQIKYTLCEECKDKTKEIEESQKIFEQGMIEALYSLAKSDAGRRTFLQWAEERIKEEMEKEAKYKLEPKETKNERTI